MYTSTFLSEKRQQTERRIFQNISNIAFAISILLLAKPEQAAGQSDQRRLNTQPFSTQGPFRLMQQQPLAADPNYNSDAVPGDPVNGIDSLKRVYGFINIYRSRHEGAYPSETFALTTDMMSDPRAYALNGFADVVSALVNPDNKYADNPRVRNHPSSNISHVVVERRADGRPISSPKPPSTRDLFAYTSVYYHKNLAVRGTKRRLANPTGFHLVLWDNGQVESIPYDQVIFVLAGEGNVTTLRMAFLTEAGVPFDCVTYEEYWTTINGLDIPPIGNPIAEGQTEPMKNTGGFESLINVSRLLSIPIERKQVWEALGKDKTEFILADVQAGAAKLNLSLQLQKMTLDQLQQRDAPAIFMTSDDKRIVTLANLDAEQAIVLDQGLTRIVSRDVLQKRYGGEALISGDANARSRAQVDDPIRIVPFASTASTDEEVTQTVNITNRGGKPLSLQIERPIPGVTEATLSSDTLAPGQSATLSLKIKWRSILKGDTQNVFVFLHTNDPVQPRLQLGFQLKLPTQSQPAKP